MQRPRVHAGVAGRDVRMADAMPDFLRVRADSRLECGMRVPLLSGNALLVTGSRLVGVSERNRREQRGGRHRAHCNEPTKLHNASLIVQPTRAQSRPTPNTGSRVFLALS